MKPTSAFPGHSTAAADELLPRLHLGCGQTYLQGYINIDFPPSEHTVQETSVADQYADLLALKYAANSIAEVRLHHVFEHFPRPVACALLASWHAWIVREGILWIEVPDFQQMARIALSRRSSDRRKCLAMRHIFGSQEAGWAVHYAGYTRSSLSKLLQLFAFKPEDIRSTEWQGTYNFEIKARKTRESPSLLDSRSTAQEYLSRFLVDSSTSEKRMLEVWLEAFDKQLRVAMPERQ